MAMKKNDNKVFNEELASDITPLPDDLNDLTPQSVYPIVGGLMTKQMVEMGEEILSKNNNNPLNNNK